jgi:hypothetical protein
MIMRKLCLIICGLTFISPFVNFIRAGDGDYFFSLSGGLLHRNAMSYEFVFEKTLKYHNAWEIGLDYYNQVFSRPADSLGNEMDYHQALLFGGAYKYNLVRYKNANLRLRGAVGIGVNEHEKFTLSVTPGFEYTYTCPSNIQLFIQEKTQFSFWSSNNSWFRVGLMIGIKIPLRN